MCSAASDGFGAVPPSLDSLHRLQHLRVFTCLDYAADMFAWIGTWRTPSMSVTDFLLRFCLFMT